MEVKEVIDKAVELGACNNSGKASDWKSLIWLFFSPQGREFCRDNNYPSMEIFREIKENIRPYGVHVDESTKSANEDKAIIGGTAELTYHGTEKAYKVIIMHGALIRLKIGNYAVVRIENISGSYTVDNDGTGRVLR